MSNNNNFFKPVDLNKPQDKKPEVKNNPKNFLHKNNKSFQKSILKLEGRIAYDGVGIDPHDPYNNEYPTIYQEKVHNKETSRNYNNDEIAREYTKDEVHITYDPKASEKSTEITFIDKTIKNYEVLLNNFTRDTKIVYLDSTKDGIKQITRALSKYKDISAIHIISHGSVGEVILGGSELNHETLQKYADDISSWHKYMKNNADILFYGCDVAGGEVGLNFVKDLSRLAQADVAASSDITGNTQKGGNWVLEKKVGNIETKELITGEVRGFEETLNAAPALSGTNIIDITSVTRDAINPSGDAVSTIITRLGSQITDADGGAVKGIAITATTNTNGKWQYSTDSGSTWTTITGAANNNALVLSDNASNKIRFVPTAGYGGYATITVRAWDQTTGSNGTYQDSSTNGGVSAFSSGTATVRVQSADNITSFTSRITMSSEVQLNTYTTNDQQTSTTIGLDNGNFVTVWISNSQDGSGYGIYGQILDKYGAKVGAEFKVNTTTAGNQTNPIIEKFNDGKFIVAWVTSASYKISAQIYNADGTTSGGELTLVDHSGQAASYPSMASRGITTLTDGSFIVTYDTSGNKSYYQRFNTSGNSLSGELSVPTNSGDSTTLSLVASLSTGGYAISWRNVTDTSVYLQKFDESNNRVGAETKISTNGFDSTLGTGGGKSLIELKDGKLLTLWMGYGEDGATNAVVGKIFNSDGSLYKSTFIANTYTFSGQSFPKVVALPSGGFAATWQSFLQDGNDWAIVAKIFDNTGTATASEFVMNTTTTGTQQQPGIAVNSSGDIFVQWASLNVDGSSYAVVGKVLNSYHAPIISGTNVTNMTSVAIDTTSPTGDTISGLITKLGSQLSDLDSGAVKGIAITSIDNTNGTWQYSTDSGTTWNNITGAANNNALTLSDSATNKIRFVPNTGYSGYANITYRAWDQTTGSNGTYQDASTNGGSTAFSSNTATIKVQTANTISSFTSGVTLSSEINVNTYTTSTQDYPRVTALDNGNFVTVWESNGQDGSGYGVYGQIIDKSGAKVGSEFRANTTTAGDQRLPTVDKLSNGNFIVVWSTRNGATDTTLRGQIYNSAGATVGSEITLANFTASSASYTSLTARDVAVLNDGSFVVVYETIVGGAYRTYYQRFDSSGTSLTGELSAPTTGTTNAFSSFVTPLSTGGYVINWQVAYSNHVYMQIFDSNNNRVGAETAVSNLAFPSATSDMRNVTELKDGKIAFTWYTNNGSLEVLGKIYNADGTVFKSDFTLNTTSANSQYLSSIAAMPDGGFIVTWTSNLQDGSVLGNVARIFDSSGNAVTNEFVFNTTTIGNQADAMPVVSTDGRIGLFWHSDNNDGNGYGIVGRIIEASSVAPDLTSTTINFTAINEDTASPAGDSVSALITALGSNYIEYNKINTSKGLAITAVNNTNGTWEYSTDNGSTWNAVGAVADNNALLLKNLSTTKMRFVPNADYNGTSTITFRAWDQGSGTEGTKVDTTTNGGTTAFSTGTATGSITVNAANDAPVLSNSPNISLSTIAEDNTTSGGDSLSSLITAIGADFSDVDSGAIKGLAITAVDNTNGAWEYSTDNGATWTAVGAVANNNALLLKNIATTKLRFVPNANYNGTSTITFRAWDQTSGAEGNKVDASTNGGTTAFSSGTGTGSITISSANDAPVISGTNIIDITSVNRDTTNPSGDAISTIITRLSTQFTDADTGAVKGIAITSIDNANGTWQYSTDSGSTWNNITGAANNNALVLSNSASNKIRFVPTIGYAGTSTITVRAWDQTTGANGTYQDASTNGSSTAFSSGTATIRIQSSDNITSFTSGMTISNEIQLNTYTANDQAGSTTIGLDNGNFVTVWQSNAQDGSGYGIYGQIVDRYGTKVGAEFRVNTTIAGHQLAPIIEKFNDGKFIVAWGTATSYKLSAQIYNADGTTSGSELTLVDHSGQAGSYPSMNPRGLATLNDGSFILTYDTSGNKSYYQRYNTSGTSLSGELSVPTNSGDSTTLSLVTSLSNGGYAISWANTTLGYVYLQKFDESNNRVDSEVLLSTPAYASSLGTGGGKSLIELKDGKLLTLWMGYGQDGSTNTVVGKIFNADGTLYKDTFIANTYTFSGQSYPKVVALPNGGFAATWQSFLQDSNDWGIVAKIFDSTGTATASEFVMNTTTTGTQQQPGVAVNNYGDIFVQWASNNVDGSSFAVVGRVLNSLNAPIVNNTNVSLTSIAEDTSNPSGDSVVSLIDSLGANYTDFSGGTVNKGIAITAVDNTNGTWQYSLDNGSTWNSVGAVADNSALLLKNLSTTKMRFVPNADYNGTANITIRAWDQTSGTEGTKVNTTTNGGTTAFSTGTATASLAITAVNDAPILSSSPTVSLSATTEDSAASPGDSISSMITSLGANFTDADAGAIKGIAITAVDTTLGTWEYSTDNGSTWSAIGAVADNNALLFTNVSTNKIRFIPNGNNGGTANITFRAWDQTSGSNGAYQDASTNGGTTAFSSVTGTGSLTISSANDAPVLSNNPSVAFSSIAANNINSTGDTVSSLITAIGGDYSDIDAAADKGIAITAIDNTLGSWEYSTDNGTNWSAIGAVANNNALLLKDVATTKIRFVPNNPAGGTANITFRAWDQTSGAEGTKVDVSTNGGTTSFSSNTGTAALTINAAPVAPPPPAPAPSTPAPKAIEKVVEIPKNDPTPALVKEIASTPAVDASPIRPIFVTTRSINFELTPTRPIVEKVAANVNEVTKQSENTTLLRPTILNINKTVESTSTYKSQTFNLNEFYAATKYILSNTNSLNIEENNAYKKSNSSSELLEDSLLVDFYGIPSDIVYNDKTSDASEELTPSSYNIIVQYELYQNSN